MEIANARRPAANPHQTVEHNGGPKQLCYTARQATSKYKPSQGGFVRLATSASGLSGREYNVRVARVWRDRFELVLLERQPIGGSPKPQGAGEVSERPGAIRRTTNSDLQQTI